MKITKERKDYCGCYMEKRLERQRPIQEAHASGKRLSIVLEIEPVAVVGRPWMRARLGGGEALWRVVVYRSKTVC